MDPRVFVQSALVVWLAASGCSLLLSGEPDDDADDAGVDADTSELFDPFGDLEPFRTSELVGDFELAKECMLNTAEMMDQPCDQPGTALVAVRANGRTYAVLKVNRFEIDAGHELRIFGENPLAILARTVIISGSIEAGSETSALNGPGADDVSECGDQLGVDAMLRVGGGGAGFGGAGGPGGGADSESGGNGGESVSLPMSLRPGCGPTNSRGGGAIQLTSVASIEIRSGSLSAGGAGGAAGANSASGGNGGGSGGMIVFDSPAITFSSASIGANGGGGGSRSDAKPGTGQPGGNATGPGCAIGGQVAGNGGGQGGCLQGGEDGSMGDDALITSSNGAGGGGGGVGFILVTSAPIIAAASTVSPAALTAD